MKILRIVVLIPFLFSLNAIASNSKSRTTKDRNKRAPASSVGDNSSGQQMSQGNPSTMGPPIPANIQTRIDWVKDCQGRHPEATREECAASYEKQQSGQGAEDAASVWIRDCIDRHPEASDEDCVSAYKKQLGGGTQDAATEGIGKEACEQQADKMWTEAGCVTKTASAEDSNGNGISDDKESKKDPESGMSCFDAHIEATNSCDSESKSWMSGMSDVVQQLGPALNQINSSTCGGVAAAQTGAAASLATFQLMCSSAMKKCTQACTGSTIPSDLTALSDCKKIGVKAADANKSAATAMMTLKSSVAQCQNAFGDLDQQATAYCTTNPTACAGNPLVGIQSTMPMGDQAGGTPAPNLGTEGVGGLTGKGAGGLDIGALGDDSGGGIGTINPSKAGDDPGGGKGGGHLGSSGGGQGDASGGRGGGGKKEGMFSNILSGFFGGGSGGGSGGGFFSKLFGGGNKSDAYASNNPNAKKVGPDLRQFLPGGLHDPNRNRGIAGQFVGKDGMAGPYSDIWKNINNRYQFKRASLVP